jgi:nucleoside-diphosphate-sugar epimerase
MNAYLVTGGAGFIGSHLAEELVRRGHRVRVLDNFLTGKRENLERLRDKIELLEGDIRNLDICRRAVKGMDFVLHQAALPSVQSSIQDPFLTNAINAGGTLNVLWAAARAKVKRLVFASSTSVYGDDSHLPKKEDTVGNPLSPYALSKWIGEKYCQIFARIYDLPTVCLRYFNVFGPCQDPLSQYAAVIPLFIIKILNGEPPVIYGDGEQTRDFVYISNVVEANILATEAKNGSGEVFNIACAESTTINALVQQINAALETHIKAVYREARPGDIRYSLADLSKARQMLKYQPLDDFSEGLKKTIAWYKERR